MSLSAYLARNPLKVGDVFRGRSLELTIPRILAFSAGAFGEPGWPLRNLHTDAEKANEAGLSAIIVSGTQFEGMLLAHLVELFGQSWYDGGELEAKIVKSVFVDETVTPLARIRAISPSKTTLVELDVWCENQNQEQVLVGTAKATIAEAIKAQ